MTAPIEGIQQPPSSNRKSRNAALRNAGIRSGRMKEKDDLSRRAGIKGLVQWGRKGLMGGAFQRRKRQGTIKEDGGRKMRDHKMSAQEDRKNRSTSSRS